MSQLLTVALAQYPSGRDCMEIVAAAKAAAAEIVVFPEMYSNGYACFDPNDPAAEARWCAEAESLEGDFVGRFREAAKARRTFRASCTRTATRTSTTRSSRIPLRGCSRRGLRSASTAVGSDATEQAFRSKQCSA
jgi:hypothetical protein